MNPLGFFKQRSEELAHLTSVLSGLAWDQEVLMPKGGVEHRAAQRSTVAALHHQRLIDPKLRDALQDLLAKKLEPDDEAGVRELNRRHDRAARIPEALVRELAEVTTKAYEAWLEARRTCNFEAFAPWLQRTVGLKRQEACCLEASESLYDALLDEYEPELKVTELEKIFTRIQPRLAGLLREIEEAQRRRGIRPIRGQFPRERQDQFGREVLTAMGFDWSRGRLDVSPHPFCTGLSPQDVRITTRFREDTFLPAFFGMIHEAGHGLYEQGLPAEKYGHPVCEAVSMGIHESQSRLWENQVGRSRAFWTFWRSRLDHYFPEQLSSLDLDELLLAVNEVKPSLIRVEADEVSYGLHVILRFELEKALLHDELPVAALPSEWNRRMESYLGIAPGDDSQGVLQDIHWSQGLMGYFPTYLLGNLYAAQILSCAKAEIGDLDEQLATGEMKALRGWLLSNIHQRGRLFGAAQLIQHVSGKPLDPQFFLSYLEEKFTDLGSL